MLLLNNSRGPYFPMENLRWAQQESNEGTVNQPRTQNVGAYKITILGSKTAGCVCVWGVSEKSTFEGQNSVEQEEARRETE